MSKRKQGEKQHTLSVSALYLCINCYNKIKSICTFFFINTCVVILKNQITTQKTKRGHVLHFSVVLQTTSPTPDL